MHASRQPSGGSPIEGGHPISTMAPKGVRLRRRARCSGEPRSAAVQSSLRPTRTSSPCAAARCIKLVCCCHWNLAVHPLCSSTTEINRYTLPTFGKTINRSAMALPPKFAGHKLTFTSAATPAASSGDGSPSGLSFEQPHTLEVYLDYVCPFSAKLYKTLFGSVAPAMRQNPAWARRLQVVFRHQVQPWHPSSTLTHEAALAVLRLAPARFFDFSAALFAAQKDYFDVGVVGETRNATYRRLARLASATAGVDEDDVFRLLAISDKPAEDGSLNTGNAVTVDLKLAVKMARLTGVHQPHTLEVYLDYVCPFSAKLYKTLFGSVAPAMRQNPAWARRLQVVFRHQVQPWHPSSTLTHEAALAVLRLAPARFFDFSAALFAAQKDYFDVGVVGETRNATYRRLARLASATAGVDEDDVFRLLAISDKPAEDGSLNTGNAVTVDLKLAVKMARLTGVHVSPTVLLDGVVQGDVSSGWTLEQWTEWLGANIAE
ncbi:hypothetical protein BN1708_009994 [Verticillium longisporum]|uniref:Thioredoxin-like fold domain-containing protein n=1 Tax=Verticillium longisporum TaxID=100787 RepID=A0A0G4KMK0_VERLO|nr:hypothetical protein BN1708_009994 [Verticillium longisporum]